MTATITRPKPKKAAANKPQSPYKRLHVIIPITDMLWASQQKPSVTQLWQECWTADPYGSRWMPLSTALGYSSFICAKKILAESGLFIFKPDKSIEDGRETVRWTVKNLHGSRIRDFWEKANSLNQQPNAEKQESNSEKRESNAGDSEIDAAPEEIRALYKASILGQSQSEQGFQKPSRTVQEQLTNSSKEFVSCVSDTLTENSREKETAIAPLEGASPQIVQGVSELEEELPAVTDCTSLTLVDAAPSQSTPLLAEKQDCGVEQKDCYEGTCSAAPVAQNEECLSSAIANQTHGQVEQSNPASLRDAARTLLGENQDCGVEAIYPHEDTCSAAPVSLNQSEIFEWLDRANVGECPPLWIIQYLLDSKYYASMRATISKFEKQWNISVVNYQVQKSSEALFTIEDITIRSKARLLRMEKLKMASLVGENPGFDFLQQCCHNDPALQIVIKKLLAKFPQWGITCVDGVLMKWNK